MYSNKVINQDQRKQVMKKILIVGILGVIGIGNALAASVPSVPTSMTLYWKPPTKRVDGTPINDGTHKLAGFEIRYRKASEPKTASTVVPVLGGSTYKKSITGLEPVPYIVTIAAIDDEGLYSDFVQFAPNAKAGPNAPSIGSLGSTIP
jgi:hypothetical protein